MTALSVSFLVLELLIIAISILIGYRRGLGRSVVRMVYLIAIGIASFLLARHISFRVLDTVMEVVHSMLPVDIAHLLEASPDIEILVGNLVGAMLVPFIFAILFGILQLLTLIFFKTISTKLVRAITGKEEKLSFSGWAGAGVGLVAGLAIAAVLLSPIFTVSFVVDSTPDETLTIFADALEENGVSVEIPKLQSTTALSATTHEIHIEKSSIKVSHVSPWSKFLVKSLTAYEVPHMENTHESATTVVPHILATAGDALYAYNVTANNGGTANDAMTNAAASVIRHLDDDPTIKKLVADSLIAMGKILQAEGSVLGVELPQSDDKIVNSMLNNIVDALVKTNADTVRANMVTLFGEPTISYNPTSDSVPAVATNAGLICTMTKLDSDDPLGNINENKEASSALSSALVSVAENDNMSAVLDDVRNYAIEKIEAAEVDLSDQKYQSLYEDINEKISTQLDSHLKDPESTIKDAAADLSPTINEIFQEYEIPVTEIEAEIVSTCITKEFMTEEYLDEEGNLNVSVTEIMDFFGITSDQIPDWAKDYQ